MRIVLLGTSEFAVPTLDALAASEHDVTLVVTAPDRPQGRGRRVEAPPLAQRAAELGLELFQPASINQPAAVERLKNARPDLLVVVAYGQILGPTVLGLLPDRIVNLHGSLLPAWRGAAPIARAIQSGATETGVSLQHVVAELDAGDVIATATMAIEPEETAGALSERMSGVAAELLLANLDGLLDGSATRTRQDKTKVTRAPSMSKAEGHVPWHLPAARVKNHVRAMSPWPSAFCRLPVDDGPPERLVLRRVETVETGPPTAMPGTVLRADEVFEVSTGYDSIRIVRLVRQGRKETTAADFLRGHAVAVGTRLE